MRGRDSDPKDICGLTGQGHQWGCEDYEKYISRGTCDCGAVRFFSKVDIPSRDTIIRIKLLNDKYGKPGKVYQGPPRIKKEAEDMVAQINSQELHPETREKLGIENEPPPKLSKAGRAEKMRAARGNKCLTCELAYTEGDIRYCSVKKCPSRIPGNLRLPYRPKGIKRIEPPAPWPRTEKQKEEESENKITIYRCGHCRTKFDTWEELKEHIHSHLSAQLPPLPKFRWWWWPSVQREWLKTYSWLAVAKR